MICNKVLLPEPLRPMSPMLSPLRIVKDTSCNAWKFAPRPIPPPREPPERRRLPGHGETERPMRLAEQRILQPRGGEFQMW